MKKLFSIILAFVLIFATGCGDYDIKTETTESSVDITQSNSGPHIIYISIDELRDIKRALSTMTPSEFMIYMGEEQSRHEFSGMKNYEISQTLMDELERTTIVLLDGKEDSVDKLMFYWERNEVQQMMFFDENSRVSLYIYTPEINRGTFGDNNETAVFQKTIENDDVTAHVYKTEDDESFCADVFVGETYIFMRSFEIKTIEDFETCFARLEFVKIGDLLSETSEFTKSESVLEETTTILPYEITTTEKSTTETTE